MRKVTAGLFHSVDGVVEAPNLWQGESFDDDLGMLLGEMMGRTDTVLRGRIGYEAWRKDFGEGPSDPYFGPFINGVPKFAPLTQLTPSTGTVVNGLNGVRRVTD